MRLRSLLFVPADSERKFAKAQASGADGLILDLEDSVAPARKPEARQLVQELLAKDNHRNWSFWVRINALDTGLTLADLSAVVRPGLDGIMVPKANGAADIVRIGHYLDALETRSGMARGTVKIVVVATETAVAMFNLGSYAPAHERLAGLTWGAEDLGAVVGSSANKQPDGDWTQPYRVVRSMCLFAAAAAEVARIDTLYADFRDPAGLEESCRISQRDGFTGRIAIHPDQVETINRCFSPSAEDLAQARRIVAAFDADPGIGTVGIDGKMYDIPHLKLARAIVAAAEG
ncbi:citrate lyase [Bosea sp. WAO]|uniref:HpcH/HpaI aldolase/citrate lyase family protein n=1 Tax=Bosea sp. WAO TaxID=406341 RepID=UPI0007487AAA|nr:CoA ester lyase [Bosea sp. WAO]KUL96462.1 citrate lyase [Bosea sp. WAO]